MEKVEILNNVKITTFDDGRQVFEPLPLSGLEKQKNKNFWQKIKDWWKNTKIKPYVKIRDLSDPIGKRKPDPFNDGSGSKKATEIGISIKF